MKPLGDRFRNLIWNSLSPSSDWDVFWRIQCCLCMEDLLLSDHEPWMLWTTLSFCCFLYHCLCNSLRFSSTFRKKPPQLLGQSLQYPGGNCPAFPMTQGPRSPPQPTLPKCNLCFASQPPHSLHRHYSRAAGEAVLSGRIAAGQDWLYS